MAGKNLDKLLEKFNKLDVNPMSTRDYILSLEQAKAGVKNLTQNEAKDLFKEELTDEDIKNLREAREQEVALKRGLIAGSAGKTATKRTRTIAKAGKLNSSLRALIPLKNQADDEESQIEKLKQEFQPQAQIIKENLPTKLSTEKNLISFNSGVDSAPRVAQKDDEINLDDDYTAGFDYDFLISTEGKLNKDVLLDILISTWDDYYDIDQELKLQEEAKKKAKKKKDEQDKESGSLLGNLLLPILLGWKWLKKLPKYLWKGIKNSAKYIGSKIKAIVKSVIEAIKKPFIAIKNWIANAFKNAVKNIKTFFKNVMKTVKNAIKNAKSAVKNFLKAAAKNVKNFFAGAKQSVKNLFTRAKQAVKGFFESSKATVKNLFSRIKDFSKIVTEKAKNIFKSAANLWKKGKEFFLKWKNKFLGLAKGVKNFFKRKPPKKVPKKSGVNPKIKKARKPPKNMKKGGAKTSVNPKDAKNLKNAKAVKNLAKAGEKQGLKGSLKAVGRGAAKVIGKIPIVNAGIDLGFMEYEVQDLMKEHGISRDEAYMLYLENKKKEGHSWWELIDPFSFGQQVALDLGVDKGTEKLVDVIFDFFSEDPKERAERIRKEARENMLKKMEKELPKKLEKELTAVVKARAEELKLGLPKDLENPNYRLKNQTPIPQKGKRGTAIIYQSNPFPQDNDDFLYNNQTPVYDGY